MALHDAQKDATLPAHGEWEIEPFWTSKANPRRDVLRERLHIDVKQLDGLFKAIETLLDVQAAGKTMKLPRNDVGWEELVKKIQQLDECKALLKTGQQFGTDMPRNWETASWYAAKIICLMVNSARNRKMKAPEPKLNQRSSRQPKESRPIASSSIQPKSPRTPRAQQTRTEVEPGSERDRRISPSRKGSMASSHEDGVDLWGSKAYDNGEGLTVAPREQQRRGPKKIDRLNETTIRFTGPSGSEYELGLWLCTDVQTYERAVGISDIRTDKLLEAIAMMIDPEDLGSLREAGRGDLTADEVNVFVQEEHTGWMKLRNDVTVQTGLMSMLQSEGTVAPRKMVAKLKSQGPPPVLGKRLPHRLEESEQDSSSKRHRTLVSEKDAEASMKALTIDDAGVGSKEKSPIIQDEGEKAKQKTSNVQDESVEESVEESDKESDKEKGKTPSVQAENVTPAKIPSTQSETEASTDDTSSQQSMDGSGDAPTATKGTERRRSSPETEQDEPEIPENRLPEHTDAGPRSPTQQEPIVWGENSIQLLTRLDDVRAIAVFGPKKVEDIPRYDDHDSDFTLVEHLSYNPQQEANADRTVKESSANVDQEGGEKIMDLTFQQSRFEQMGDDNWSRFQEFFQLPEGTTRLSLLQIPGIRTKTPVSQLFAAWFVVDREINDEVILGSMIADGTGFGKTGVTLLVHWLWNLLVEMAFEVFESHAADDKKHRHGRKGCPTYEHNHPLACVCVLSSFKIKRIMKRRYPSLILVPPTLIANWIREFEKHIDIDHQLSRGVEMYWWQANVARKTIDALPPRVQMLNRHSILVHTEKNNETRRKPGCIVLCSKYAKVTTTDELNGTYWARITVDEAHDHKGFDTAIIKWQREDPISRLTRSLFLTATPITVSPKDVKGLVSILQRFLLTARWEQDPKKVAAALAKYGYFKKNSCIKELRKAEKAWAKAIRALKNNTSDTTSEQTAAEVISNVLQPFTIRRTERTRVEGRPLIPMPACDFYTIEVRIDDRTLMMLNDFYHKKEAEALKTAEHMHVSKWLKKMRYVRFYACFPHLLVDPIEETDLKGGAIDKSLAAYRNMGVTALHGHWAWERLGDIDASPKIRYLRMLIEKHENLKEDEPMVVFAFGPAECMAIYVWLKYRYKKGDVACVSGLDRQRRAECVTAFQQGEIRFLVGTCRVMGQGLTLTRAFRAVIFMPEWQPALEMQAKGRVWRTVMAQGAAKTYVYRMRIKGFEAEKIITDRNDLRGKITGMVEASGDVQDDNSEVDEV